MQIEQGLAVDTYQITATADELEAIRYAVSSERSTCLSRLDRDKGEGVRSCFDFATQAATCGAIWHDIYVAEMAALSTEDVAA